MSRAAHTRTPAGFGILALAAAGAVAVLANAQRRHLARATLPRPASTPPPNKMAQQLNRASALLAGSALADSAVEHYRGSFHNNAMYLPLAIAAQTVVAGLHGSADRNVGADGRRDASHQLAVLNGIAGIAFHFYNIAKRPGGISWVNLFYAAPLGAPAALSLAGMLGLLAERVREDGAAIFGAEPSRVTAWLAAAGLVGTAGEAGLLHFRGAYHNPAMAIPVVVPPVAAALLAGATMVPRMAAPARWSLRLLLAIGFIGSAFHAYGVHRNMGGWRNWSQNLLNGPPLPAPPAFTALAIAGLAALGPIERDR
jgi:hypothetical protein